MGFQNYIKLWDDPNFWVSLKNNVLWLILYMLAVPDGALHRALPQSDRGRGCGSTSRCFFFPFVISQVVVGLIFGWFYNPDFGVIGSASGKRAFCEETTNILGNVTFTCSRTGARHSLERPNMRPTASSSPVSGRRSPIA